MQFTHVECTVRCLVYIHTYMCNHHYNFRGSPSPQKESPHPSATTAYSPWHLSPSPQKPLIDFLSVAVLSRTFYISHATRVLLCLASLSIICSRFTHVWSSRRGSVETNPTGKHEVAGSVPGLAQWVKGPTLPRAVV